MPLSGDARVAAGRPGEGRFGDIWRAYSDCPISVKIRVLGRYLLSPFGSLLDFFPPEGRILDVGCGDGLLLFLLSRDPEPHSRMCTGIDPAENKIGIARRAHIENAEFRAGEVSALQSNSYDCVSITDVLYLLPKSQWAGFLEHSIRVLRKNGLLIVKEVTNVPRWKFCVAYLQEILAIKIIGFTKGDTPHFESIDVYRASIEAAGADIFRIEHIDAWRPHAHVLLLARKRG